MKTVSKIVLCSCIFCYFAGFYIIGVKFGLLKLLSHYGLSRRIEEVSQDFPNMKYLYIALIIYTIVYVFIAYIIMLVTIRHEKQMVQFQQQASEINDFADDVNVVLAKIIRDQENWQADDQLKNKLKMLQRQVAALPPQVIRDKNMKADLTSMISNMKDMMSNNDYAKLSANLDELIDEVKSMKRRSVNRKYQ